MKKLLLSKTIISFLGVFLFAQISYGQVPTDPAPTPDTYNPYRVLAVFSDVNDQKPYTDYFNLNADTTEAKLVQIGDDNVLEYKNFLSLTMEMEEEYDVSYMKYVHVDVYPLESFDVAVKPLTRWRRRYIDAADTVTLVANQWNSLDVPIEDVKQTDNGETIVLDRFAGFRLEKDSSSYPTIYVDNVYVYDDFVDNEAPKNYTASVAGKTHTSVILELTGDDNSGEFYHKIAYGSEIDTVYSASGDTAAHVVGDLDPDTEYTFSITAYDNDGNVATDASVVTATTYAEEPTPSIAAESPAYEANTVISLFSNEYTDACPWAFGNWNQQTLIETTEIEDNNMLKWSSFNYQGIEINGNQPGFNAESCDGLQLDIWTANAPSFDLILISDSPNGKFQAQVSVDLELEEWNSVDISMDEFLAAEPGFEPANIIQFKFESPDHSAKLPLDDVLYMDNILFYGGDPESLDKVNSGGGGETSDIELPLTFEEGDFTWTDFDGGAVTVVDNTKKSGINNSDKVAKMVKGAGQPWAGSYITLESAIDFSISKTFKMKVFTPEEATKVLLKVENLTNPDIAFEKEVATTKANEWEELTFDFSDINSDNQYHKVVLIFELGTMGDGSADFTYMFDDIMLEGMTIPEKFTLPVNFESSSLEYAFTNFDGGEATVVDNPDMADINTSTKVGEMVKGEGQPWAGAYLTLDEAIDFSESKTFRMKVWAPKVGTKVLLKVENGSDSGISHEVEVETTKANTWEELTFDYSGIDDAKEYHKVVLIFDLGTVGDGSADFTYYFDDIKLGGFPASFDKFQTSGVKLFTHSSKLQVTTESPERVNIYEVTGRMIYSGMCERTIDIPLEQGIYIVKVGNMVSKCLIRE